VPLRACVVSLGLVLEAIVAVALSSPFFCGPEVEG
jgi:hypothetical protein